MVGESEFSLNYGLSLLAHVDSLTELVGILIEEKEGEARYKLLLASGEDLNLILEFLVVIFKDFYWPPDVFLVLIDW